MAYTSKVMCALTRKSDLFRENLISPRKEIKLKSFFQEANNKTTENRTKTIETRITFFLVFIMIILFILY